MKAFVIYLFYHKGDIMSVIEIKNVTKTYGDVKAVKDISLTLNEGEILGFIGPNGAGKSTTLKAISGLINIDCGSISICQLDSVKDGAEARKLLGYMPSELVLYPKLTGREFLKYACDLKGASDEKILPLARRFELDLKKKCAALSLGNKKKLMLIAALVGDPKVIILDEPTTGLDPLMQDEFYNVLKEEQARGASILFSSHTLSEVEKICKRVAVIKNGEIIADEDIESISKKNYKRVKVRSEKLTKLNFEGVENLKIEDSLAVFDFVGDLNLLLTELKKIKVEDFSVEDAGLESVFLHYYK